MYSLLFQRLDIRNDSAFLRYSFDADKRNQLELV